MKACQAQCPGQGHVHLVVGGDIRHVPALFQQSIDISIYGISDNFRYPVPAQAHPGADILLGPAQAVQADDGAGPACLQRAFAVIRSKFHKIRPFD
jgi:hypothetical protein